MFYDLKQQAKETMRDYSPQIHIASVIAMVLSTVLERFANHFDKAAEVVYHAGPAQAGQAIIQYYTSMSPMQKGYLSILSVLIWVISAVLGYGFYYYCLRAARGREVGYGDLFDGFYRPVRIIVAELLTSIIVGLGFIALIVPGVILLLGYSQTTLLLADNPDMTAVEAMRESRLLMRGHRWEFFLLVFSFIGWSFLSALTYGLSEIYASPYRVSTYCNYYMDLTGTRHKSEADYTVEDDYDEF